ncbi:MAG: NADH-quinone oxidoreductase subunit C [Firmicutes bacterium]|nr:NADH-quinone oxidoreductase subunit C [Bacillota bacterium]
MTVEDQNIEDRPAENDIVASLPIKGLIYTESAGTVTFFPSQSQYLELTNALKGASFVTCSDLCAVDYLRHLERPLPSGVSPERFEVVVQLLSLSRKQRVRIRLQIPEENPHAPSLFYIYPGAENMEREAFDLMGIVFDEHPDMTRILMPHDWEGHPLRKDYSVGRVPVQFKEAPGPR